MVSVERLQRYMDIAQEPMMQGALVGGGGGQDPRLPQPSVMGKHAKDKGQITFLNLSARYPTRDTVCLKNVNIFIKPGERVK